MINSIISIKIIKPVKLFILFVFTYIVINIFLSNVFAYSTLANNKPIYGVTNTRLNFRSTASTNSSVIKVLAKGTRVKMVGTIDSFYIVQLASNEVGVLSKNYVTTTSTPPNALTYTNISKQTATLTTSSVNVRRGPGTNYAKISTIASSSNSFTVIGYIDDFYMVVLKNGTVGMIKKSLVKLSSSTNPITNTTGEAKTTGDTLEEQVLSLINAARKSNNLKQLTMGTKLLKIARLKAADMVKFAYFSHSSPTYGTPFKMMQTYLIPYKSAGENIAGNPSIEAAVKSWLASQTHRDNLLNVKFNYIGVGVSKSSIYGNVIVAMFAEV